MIITEVSGNSIKDSRGDLTISVKIKTNVGTFTGSAPNGKSKGKWEAKSYKKNLEGDIKTLEKFSDYFSEEEIENFNDLRRIEDIMDGHIGANTQFALETAALKAIAKEQNKEIWQLINPKAKKVPRFIGNCIGGGKHSSTSKKPDFQEFLLIPNKGSAKKNFEKNKKDKEMTEKILKKFDKDFKGKKNDEDAWMTSLNEREVLEILKETGSSLGLDIAASGFYKRKKYHYENPMLKRDIDEQLFYIANLTNNFKLLYVEDPFEEEDFESFTKLLKATNGAMIVGDDLTVTNYKRLEKAIKMKAINAMIVKPNQNGSLINVKRVCKLAKEHKIKLIFSHRSGETSEDILADLAFGFGADFMKCGITKKEREIKIKRLIEIEKSLK